MSPPYRESEVRLEMEPLAADLMAEELGALQMTILRILAEGRPAGIDDLVEVTSHTTEDLAEMLARMDPIERASDGSVVGLGLSLIPTRHQVELPRRSNRLYAWCAPDALVLPAIVGEPSRVLSPCRATGLPITIEVGHHGVTHVNPPEAVVSFVLSPDTSDLRSTGCEHQNLFVSSEAASDWLAHHPGTELVSVREAFELLVDMYVSCGCGGDLDPSIH